MKRMKIKLKKSFNIFLVSVYPDFSEITQVRCVYHINDQSPRRKISLLYINVTEECTQVLPECMYNDHRSYQKLINYIRNIKEISERYYCTQKLSVL